MPQRVGRKETRFIASLFEVPREVGHASLDEFLDIIIKRCAEWFGANTVSLFLLIDGTDSMELAAAAGQSSQIPKKATIQLGKGIAGIAAAEGSPVLINDLGTQAKFRTLVGNAPSSLASSMVVPLWANQSCVGVLNLSRTVGNDRFSEADLKLARSVASHLALAVANARLVASLRGAVQDLESERAKFRGIFDGLGLAAFLLDRQGNVVESNPAAQQLEFLPVDAIRALLKQSGKKREKEIQDPTSGRSWMAVMNPISNGATLLLEETTEREKNRKEIDRLNRLAEIGQMTAAIAHEIRNPLTGIRSAAQMIRELPEAAEEFTGIIEHEAMKLNELCSQFLGFAKPLELNTQPMSITDCLKRVVKLIAPQFKAKQVQMDVQIDAQMPMIEGDPHRWEQVFHNLLLNALQASVAGGTVRFGVTMTKIWIEDHGCGMTQDQVQRLFSPFFTTKAQGTGLGLSTVKKILDAHGAEISVSSQPGMGTRFEVLLPMRRAA